MNRNHETTETLFSYDTVSFSRVCNYFNELSYIVYDCMTNTFFDIEFSRWHGDQERKAYEAAARVYNSLVPETEAIPLF